MNKCTVINDEILSLGVAVFTGEYTGMSSLYRELSGVTHAAVRFFFGTAFHVSQRHQDYSRDQHVLDVLGARVTLYMSQGVWRFGAIHEQINESRRNVILKIEELLKNYSDIQVEIDYASDDSCQIILWARGKHEKNEFLKACEKELLAWDGRELELTGKPVKYTHWRTVKASEDNSRLGGVIRIESKPGKGAYAVTFMDEWLPLHTN